MHQETSSLQPSASIASALNVQYKKEFWRSVEAAVCNSQRMKVRDVLKMLQKDGWYHVRTTGSHRHFKHDSKVGIVTVPGHPGDDVAAGTLSSIKKQAGLK